MSTKYERSISKPTLKKLKRFSIHLTIAHIIKRQSLKTKEDIFELVVFKQLVLSLELHHKQKNNSMTWMNQNANEIY